MRASVISTRIYPLKCEKLNVKSFISISLLKIVALKIFDSNNVMVPSVNKYGYLVKNIFSSSYVIPSIKL
jgi:hypothetical protein